MMMVLVLVVLVVDQAVCYIVISMNRGEEKNHVFSHQQIADAHDNVEQIAESDNISHECKPNIWQFCFIAYDRDRILKIFLSSFYFLSSESCRNTMGRIKGEKNQVFEDY